MTRMTWLYFIHAESDATEIFKNFLVDVRADGNPSVVKCVRSDGGGEFHISNPFENLCRDRRIRQEPMNPNTPERNAVAEGATALVESAALAATHVAIQVAPLNSPWAFRIQLPAE